ncbi:MAG: chemotaxis protein CheX [Clostridiales bacterium]|jgi:chemotaxis protein CheX|nr:chemotaxis protein CheX [Clostridiales bacterium]
MNATLVNPFLQGAQEILATICGTKPPLGNVFVKKIPYNADEVSIQIDIIGDLTGKAIYTMKRPAACFVVSKMMSRAVSATLDDISKSALAELGNMISGRVATMLSNNGKVVDITPPLFGINAPPTDFSFPTRILKLICMPLNLPDGLVFELDIFIIEEPS